MRNGGYFILDLTNGVIGSSIEKASDYIDAYKKPVLVYSTLTNPFFANYVRENEDKIEIGGVLEYDTTTEELTIVQGGGSGGATIYVNSIGIDATGETNGFTVGLTISCDKELTSSDIEDLLKSGKKLYVNGQDNYGYNVYAIAGTETEINFSTSQDDYTVSYDDVTITCDVIDF